MESIIYDFIILFVYDLARTSQKNLFSKNLKITANQNRPFYTSDFFPLLGPFNLPLKSFCYGWIDRERESDDLGSGKAF